MTLNDNKHRPYPNFTGKETKTWGTYHVLNVTQLESYKAGI